MMIAIVSALSAAPLRAQAPATLMPSGPPANADSTIPNLPSKGQLPYEIVPLKPAVRQWNPDPTGDDPVTRQRNWQLATERLPVPNQSPQPPVGSIPARIPPPPPASDPIRESDMPPMQWWPDRVSQQILGRPRWVSFDLETVLIDALQNSPRIQSVSHRTGTALERIVQQDAAFDPTVLLNGGLGRTNDPVGSVLTTGGADRLVEETGNFQGGVRRVTRRGTELEITERLGLTDSNSDFFVPNDQGDSRLSVSLTKPLLDRGGQVYNERLITQARIDSRVAWQEMRGEVEQRIAEVITAYWQLYQIRCELSQQRDLLSRGQSIERLLVSRSNFDASRIEITKAQQRIARRYDQMLVLEAELKKQQSRLAAAVGSNALLSADMELEMIPVRPSMFPETNWTLRDCVARALENRPEVRAATHELESAALETRVTRAELTPQLNAVFNGYLSALNGESQVFRSFVEQFEAAPGLSARLEYELPYGRRAAKSRVREAQKRYQQLAADLQETVQQTKSEVELALIDVRLYAQQRQQKQLVLKLAIDEENILMVRWRTIGGDGSRIGIVLENLLDAQQRRTDAERDWVASQTACLVALVRLQRAMGTLLINEGISPHQHGGAASVSFVREDLSSIQVPGQLTPPQLTPPQSLPSESVIDYPPDDPLLDDNPLP
ncbi:TolC family protein [Stieleria varia]|uniref:Outer membrane efflux protein n=1 Tax=Stieleria varia TaxID=2528005 RepID=A0A5C6B7K4_9BACT|nr:TolC family protein [Stieleria varia]TWU06484.1 Outer membrane efflux protein [Stieleria varia]